MTETEKKRTPVEVKIVNPTRPKSPGIIVHESEPKTKEGKAVEVYSKSKETGGKAFGFASYASKASSTTTTGPRSPGDPINYASLSYPKSTAGVAAAVLIPVMIFVVNDDYGTCRFEVKLKDGYKCSDLLNKIQKVRPDMKWEVAGEDEVGSDSEDLWTLEEIESCFHEEVKDADALLKAE